MEGVLLDLRPSIRRRARTLTLLFLPNDDFAIVRTRRENLAELWVRPRDLPDGTCMATAGCIRAMSRDSENQGYSPFERLSTAPLRFYVHIIKDFDRPV